MKPRHLLLFLCLLPALNAPAQDCLHYGELIQLAQADWKKGDFEKALNRLSAAREHCPSKGAEIDAQLVAFTREISVKYEEAEREKKRADKAAKAAIDSKNAILAEKERGDSIYRRAFSNDIASRSQIALRNGDRTGAFRLAEFAHRFVDDNNPNVTRALIDALYYNDNPDHVPLPWHSNLEGHTSGINSVAITPDGKKIVSGSSDGTAKIWDLPTGTLLRTVRGHTAGVLSVAISPDGKTFATGSSDKGAKLWDLETGKMILYFPAHTAAVNSVAFSPDGKKLATASSDKTVKIWELAVGVTPRTLEGHTSGVKSVVFSPDGKWLATGGSYDGMVKIWDLETGNAVQSLKSAAAGISMVAFSPACPDDPAGGKLLATAGSYTAAVELWDVKTGKVTLKLDGHPSGVSSLAFSSDGTRLATGGASDKTAKIWDLSDGGELLTFSGHTSGISTIAFAPDGTVLVTGSSDKTVKIWDLKSTEVNLPKQYKRLDDIVFSPNGKMFAMKLLYDDPVLRVYDAESGEATHTLQGHQSDITSIVFSPDGRKIASGSADGTAKLWDLQTDKLLLTLQIYVPDTLEEDEDAKPSVTGLAFSPNGKLLATAGLNDHTVRVWNLDSGKEMLNLGNHTSAVTQVAFSPDGRLLATGSYGLIKIWDLKSGKTALALESYATCIAFSPDAKWLATGETYNNTAKIWDLKTGDTAIENQPTDTLAAALPQEGKRLAPADGKTSKSEVVKTGKATLSLEGHAGEVASVAFSPDGKRLATGSYDKTAKIWDLETGKVLITLEGHTGAVLRVAFPTASPNGPPAGKRLATGTGNGTVRIWELDAETLIRKLHAERRLATLTLPQLEDWDLTGLLDARPGNEERLRQANEVWQTAAFADLYAQNTSKSQDLARTANDYSRAARLYRYALNSGGDSVLMLRLNDVCVRHANDILGSGRPDTALRYALFAYKLLPADDNTLSALVRARLAAPAAQRLEAETDPAVMAAAGDYFKENEDWTRAREWYEKSLAKKHSAEILLLLYEVCEKDSFAFNFNRFLQTDSMEELLSYARFFYRKKDFHKTLPFVERRMRLQDVPGTREDVVTVAAQVGTDRFPDLFLVPNPDSLKIYMKYFTDQESTGKYATNVPICQKALRIGEKLLTLENTSENRAEVASICNSLAWNQIFIKAGAEADTVIRRGIALDPKNKYLPTNLPHALLLQNRFDEAKALYLEWADKAFGEQNLATYREAFLDDFKAFRKAYLRIERMDEIEAILKKGQ